jgi:hypothetical protein
MPGIIVRIAVVVAPEIERVLWTENAQQRELQSGKRCKSHTELGSHAAALYRERLLLSGAQLAQNFQQ